MRSLTNYEIQAVSGAQGMGVVIGNVYTAQQMKAIYEEVKSEASRYGYMAGTLAGGVTAAVAYSLNPIGAILAGVAVFGITKSVVSSYDFDNSELWPWNQ